MVVSFKVAKVGWRYRPKVFQIVETENGNGNDHQERLNEGRFNELEDKDASHSKELTESAIHQMSEDLEVSFLLNLFLNGFFVGKPTGVFSDVPKQLVPDDRDSKALFTAIEHGWLPREIFYQRLCKYVNGAAFCEIGDYCNCLSQKASSALAETSPTIHRVLLQMCAEDSISNESWPYKDMLEVESRTLRALQPALHLNPYPLLDYGELPTQKISLGITYGWKKRKLSDLPKFNSQNSICLTSMVSSGTQDSNFQSDLAYQGIEVPNSGVVPNLLAGKFAQVNIHIYQAVNGCNETVAVDLSSSSMNVSRNQREPTFSLPAEKSECEAQSFERPILKIPMQEPNFTLMQNTWNLAEIGLAPASHRKNNLLYQKIGSEKSIHERYSDQREILPLKNKGQQEIVEGNPKQPTGMLNFVVKQEPRETTDFPNSDVRKIKDKSSVGDMRCNPSKLQQLLEKSPLLVRVNSHLADTGEKNLRNEMVTEKVLPSPQVTYDVRTASLRLFQGESLLGEASLPTRQKKNIQPRVSSIRMTNSLASTRKIRTADASSALASPCLERFVKIGAVTQRYKLNDKKRKLDQLLPSKQFFNIALVALHLANSEDRRLKYATAPRIPLSKCSIDRKHNGSKTRTLTFVHQAYVHQRKEISQNDSGAQIKLVMSEILNEGKVEITVVYEQEERDSISFPLLPACPNTHFADLFAAHFQSLIAKEGYHIARDQIEPMVLSSDDESSSAFIGSDPAACGSLLRPSPTVIPGQAASMLPCMKSRMLALNSNTGQLSSQNIIPRSHLLPPANFQLPIQNLSNNLSKLQPDVAAQVRMINPQCPEFFNKDAHLQFQMMQRQRRLEQLAQKTSVGGLGAAMGGVDTMQLYGDIGGLGHGVMALGGAMNSLQSGQIPWMGNLDQLSNLDSNVSSSRKQCFGMMPDHSSLLTTLGLRAPECPGGAVMNQIAIHGSTGVVQMQRPTIPDMAYLLSNQQLPPMPQIPQQLQMPYSQQQQQEMILVLQSAEAANFAEHVSSPIGDINSTYNNLMHCPKWAPFNGALNQHYSRQMMGMPW